MTRALRLPAHIAIRPSEDVTLSGIEKLTMADGIPLFLISGGNEPVFRLEFVFRAGKLFEQQHHASSATAALLTDGTRKMNSIALAEEIEYYGATVRCYTSPDTLTLSVHSMTRFAEPLLELIRDILLEPTFPEDELVQYQKKKIQRYKMGQMQNEYLANRYFSEHIFGKEHPYGYTSTPEDILKITADTLRTHHATLGFQCLDVFLAGDTRNDMIAQVESVLKDIPPGEHRPIPSIKPSQSTGQHHIPGPQPHQISVRIGNQVIDRNHEDYPGLFVLNTILGGYHGSRLIRNLREAKGLTYGVQSNLEGLLQSMCMVVSTDANVESREQVVHEIYHEFSELRTQLVGKREMEMVKNYICGNFLMQIDGPLNVVDTIKPLVLHQLPLTYFEEFISQLRSVSAKTVRSLAQQYFDPQEMVEVVVG